ncbi:MAG: GyrI-like domain-containing protein [Verrucomicrobia bacterium]|nr:GyrI-like domain-containing protein [Verrucomicrobiota bacterium]
MVRVYCLVALLLSAWVCASQAGEVIEPLAAADAAPIDVKIAKFEPVNVACMEHTGPYSNIGKAISTLMQQLSKQKIKPAGSVMAIYFNDPNTVAEEDLRWDVVVVIAEGTEVAAPLKARVLEAGLVGTTHYRGAPDKLGAVYAQLVDAVVAMGHHPVGPAMESYNGIPSSRLIDVTIMFPVAAGPGVGEPHGIAAELVIPEPVLLVFGEYSGGPGDIGPSTDAFIAELGKQGVEPVGPIMHVLLDGASMTPDAELHWQVAVPIEGERELSEPLKLRWLPERVVARTACPGPFEEAAPAVHGLIEYATMRGYIPVGPPIVGGGTRGMHPKHPGPEPTIEDPVEGIHPPEHPPQETILTIRVEKMPPVDSEIVIVGPQVRVVMTHEGPFEELNQATESFMAALEAQGVEPMGPCTRTFHTEPDKGPYVELFVPIAGEREVAAPLQMRVFPEAAYARAHYEGPKAGVRMAHEIMVHQMAERGWRPSGPLMQTIFDAGEEHVACELRFVVAKMEGEPEPEGEPAGVIEDPVFIIDTD